jgi:hypothetical protein
MTRLKEILVTVEEEVRSAQSRFPKFNSGHEGYAVIAEELDELWADVKANDTRAARREAIQVAAMAVRFLLDVGGDGGGA